MLKKSLLAIAALAWGSIATAGAESMSPAKICTPGDVTLSCPEKHWDLGVQALYFKPSFNKYLRYDLPTGGGEYGPLNIDEDWAYRLEGSYHFNTGTDITINWTHLDSDDDLGLRSGKYLLLLPINPQVVQSNYNLSEDTDYDAVNLVMGQTVNMSLLQRTRFFGGLQYAKIKTELKHSYLTDIVPQVTGGGVRSINEIGYSGLGPVVGLGYAYDVLHGLSLTANASGSVSYGTYRHQYYTDYKNNLVADSTYLSKKILVPSFDTKIGANYAYEMPHGILNLEGGYEVVNYFIFGNGFALNGPYVGVKWLGNA